jgi:hypothetical protein
MRSTSALSENGFSQKSKAPRLTMSTAVGTSAWPVRKITGITCTRPRSTSLSNSASPLMPGMRTSSSRQQACAGRKPAASIASNSSALRNVAGQQAARAQQPGERVAHAGVVVDDEHGGVGGGLHQAAGIGGRGDWRAG